MRVVFALDRAFAPPVGVALSSLLESRRGAPPRVHLFVSSLDPADAERFRALAGRHGAPLEIHPVDDTRFDGVPRGDRFGLATWYRFLMPELLEGDRAIYLDGDLLVRGDLAPLWNTALDGAWLAAVPQIGAQATRHPALGLSPTHAYFNAGVLLVDLAAWRREDVAGRALEVARRRASELRYFDQDALNLVAQDRVRELSCVWNFMPYQRDTRFHEEYPDIEFGRLAPVITHFAGERKPWTSTSRDPWLDAWREARGRSPWAI